MFATVFLCLVLAPDRKELDGRFVGVFEGSWTELFSTDLDRRMFTTEALRSSFGSDRQAPNRGEFNERLLQINSASSDFKPFWLSSGKGSMGIASGRPRLQRLLNGECASSYL
jgi:hypothetical protein